MKKIMCNVLEVFGIIFAILGVLFCAYFVRPFVIIIDIIEDIREHHKNKKKGVNNG